MSAQMHPHDPHGQYNDAKRSQGGAPEAVVVLSHVMAMYSREMSDFEMNLWLRMITDFGDAAVVNFLARHVEISVFAPKPAEMMKALMPGRDCAEGAMAELVRAVALFGPYSSPRFSDPVLPAAVLLMGGWVKVNETLPDAANRYEYDGFQKRFEICYRHALSKKMMGDRDDRSLMGIHQIGCTAAALCLTN